MWYSVFGSINALLICVSLMGIYSQMRTIWRRKNARQKNVTAVLSVNQFTMSFLAYFSFFVHGASLADFHHYIVWPRLTASLFVGWILFEIWRDRRSWEAFTGLFTAILCMSVGVLYLMFAQNPSALSELSTLLIIVVTLFLGQGYVQQIRLILRAGDTGAVDLKMSQFIFLMDLSTIALAISMGLKDGWPLLFLAVTSALTKLVIMYLFHWVKVSPKAKQKRALFELNRASSN